ncbi:hypothetical protein PHET_05369 [Paragonimus heterotremus]|uniref:SURF1-like protein n=1 Tax=Paragonimus heterotremus TaxID=100268 RepID=A0A8J4WHP5_9TREM|nr:hypothetical protein PHET_05369 [Paragonimus heterotremus]
MLLIRRINPIPCGLFRSFTSRSTSHSKRRLTWKSYVTLVFPVTCFALGYWQIERRKWKLGLISQLEQNIRSPPIPLPATAQASTDLPEYCPIRVRGHFDHRREVLIGPRPLISDFIVPAGPGSEWNVPHRTDQSNKSGYLQSSAPVQAPLGYFVVTPFFLADRPGDSILVNRGWIQTNFRDPHSRRKGQVEGTVELSGFVRYGEKLPLFKPSLMVWPCVDQENQAPQVQYYCRAISQMAEQLHTLPLLIDANYESTVSGGPIGGQTRIQLRNEHASYIFTWFSLAIIGSGMWIYTFLL